jgi:hypothetical protein
MKRYGLSVVCLICALLFFSSVSFASEGSLVKGEQFFTRTNLKHEGKMIYFHNMSKEKDIIPVGTPVTIKSTSSKTIKFKMGDGEKIYRITDSPAVYSKYLVSNKDEIGLQNMNDKAKTDVKDMQIYEGMTKNEVFVSKGCPAYIGVGEKSWGKTLEQLMASNTWYYNMDTRRREMIISFQNDVVSSIVKR